MHPVSDNAEGPTMPLDYPPMDRETVELLTGRGRVSCPCCPWKCLCLASVPAAFEEPLLNGWWREGYECPACRRRFTVYTHYTTERNGGRLDQVELLPGWPPDAVVRPAGERGPASEPTSPASAGPG